MITPDTVPIKRKINQVSTVTPQISGPARTAVMRLERLRGTISAISIAAIIPPDIP
jgi:hypothetical protein